MIDLRCLKMEKAPRTEEYRDPEEELEEEEEDESVEDAAPSHLSPMR